jgi:hypothetical protein
VTRATWQWFLLSTVHLDLKWLPRLPSRSLGGARFDATGAIRTRLFWRFRAGFPALHQWKGILQMKTFIVYDLDSQMPVAVGEQVSAETARYCASVATGIFEANLLAEEIDLEKQITY